MNETNISINNILDRVDSAVVRHKIYDYKGNKQFYIDKGYEEKFKLINSDFIGGCCSESDFWSYCEYLREHEE